MTKLRWETRYSTVLLVAEDGEILASVIRMFNDGIYVYKDKKYISLESAKAAAERDNQCEAITWHKSRLWR